MVFIFLFYYFCKDWVIEARSLLDFISSKDDAKPFLEPVNVEEFTVSFIIVTSIK